MPNQSETRNNNPNLAAFPINLELQAEDFFFGTKSMGKGVNTIQI